MEIIAEIKALDLIKTLNYRRYVRQLIAEIVRVCWSIVRAIRTEGISFRPGVFFIDDLLNLKEMNDFNDLGIASPVYEEINLNECEEHLVRVAKKRGRSFSKSAKKLFKRSLRWLFLPLLEELTKERNDSARRVPPAVTPGENRIRER